MSSELLGSEAPGPATSRSGSSSGTNTRYFANGIFFGCAGSGGMLQLTFVVTGYRSENARSSRPRDRSFGERLEGALAYMRRRRGRG